MGKRWRIPPHDSSRVAQLERTAGLAPVVARLLVSRGIDDPAAARYFLDAKLTGLRDPEELPGLSAAADLVHDAIASGRKIVIYGDYDADGMTAAALLVRCLRLLGGEPGCYVPNRMEEGYGVNEAALRALAERGAEVVITVDCGIASIAEAALARKLGLTLVVTDHHEMAAELPPAAAIVHPRLPGSRYPFAGLCGAGVAFKLAWALCQRASQAKKVGEAMKEFLLAAIGMVALGTVADLVPLVDENRILVRHGLVSLRERPPPGLAELLRITQLDRKPCLDSEDIAFTLAPRLNAAGRLGQAQLAVELLTTDAGPRAAALAEYIHELNNSRDSLERSVYLAAQKQIKERFDPAHESALVLAGRGWHPGVIGIVAGRLAEKYHRPVVLISLDDLGVKPGTGSARTAGGLNLHQALNACGEALLAHGGHAAAAGLKIDEAQIESFRGAFCEYVAGELADEDLVAEIHIDAEAPLAQLTLQTVEEIEQLAPFGQGNPRPVLCASEVSLAEPPKRIGSSHRHLALKLRQHNVSMRAVAFGQGEQAESLAEIGGPLDIAYRPVINHFAGRRSVEVHVVDWRPAERPVRVG